MMCAEPGMMPMMKPSTEPRAIGTGRLVAIPRGSAAVRAAWARSPRRRPCCSASTGFRRDRTGRPRPARCRCRRRARAGRSCSGNGRSCCRCRSCRAAGRGTPSAACGPATSTTCRRGRSGRAPAARCIPAGRISARCVASGGATHGQHDDAERAGDPRADRGDAERGAGAAFAAPSRCRRCRSSPTRLRPESASGSRWSSRHIASRNRCRRA